MADTHVPANNRTTPEPGTAVLRRRRGFAYNVARYRFVYMLFIPAALFYLVFCYFPMYGVVVAFQKFNPYKAVESFLHPQWVGFQYFRDFFNSYYFVRILRNTLLISFYKLLFGFPTALILAILLNEARNLIFRKVVQTITYMPYFLSWVMVAGLVMSLTSPVNGPINAVIRALGGQPIEFLNSNTYFRGLLVGSHLWVRTGWDSIIFLAALAGVDPELYESAYIDGASRLQKIRYIDLPSISEIVAIMLILQVGGILNAGQEQILLLYSPGVYESADIIDTYVYREGLLNLRYSFSAAVGLFKNVFGLLLVLGTNRLAKRLGSEGLF